MQIAVLGMHRSGTSVLTRLLGFLGCYLGDEQAFNPIRPDNPRGDWERTDVWALNEAVLAALDSSWSGITRFDLGRLDAETRAGFESQARTIVQRLDAHRPWAIKDPRLCLTLPVWRPAMPELVCVIAHRAPLAVARSLGRRDGFPLAVGVALWEAHVLAALRNSTGLPRVVVAHARLVRDAPSALRELRMALEREGATGLHDADAGEVQGFVDPDLLHREASASEEADYLNPAQQRLADAVEDGSALGWTEIPRLSESARNLLEGYFELVDERSRLRADLLPLPGLQDELSQRNEELTHLRDELERLRVDLAGVAAERDGHAAEIEAQKQRGAALASELQHADERRKLLDRNIDALIERGNELDKLIELILKSRRWRYGDRAGALLGKALLRPAEPRAAEHAERIVSAFRGVCREISQKRAADD